MMTKTMHSALTLALALGTLPAVAQAAYTTAVPAAADPHMQPASGAPSAGEPALVPAAGSYTVETQVKDDIFTGTEKFEQGASDVTNVNLDGGMLGMVGDKGKGDLAHKLNFIVVHSFTYDKPGMYKMEDVDAYRKKLTDGSWNCFIHTRDKDGTTDICSRTMGDHETHEMVILTAEPKELTFVHLSGKMSLDDLSKMGHNVGGPPTPTPPTPPAPRQ